MTKHDERRFSHDRFASLVSNTIVEIDQLQQLKGGEYAGDEDCLANFRRNAQALDLANETIWAVYAAKHWDAVMQYVKDIQSGKERLRLESIAGRCDDLIVYLILFKAMVEERDEAITEALTPPEEAELGSSDPRMKLSLKDVAQSIRATSTEGSTVE